MSEERDEPFSKRLLGGLSSPNSSGFESAGGSLLLEALERPESAGGASSFRADAVPDVETGALDRLIGDARNAFDKLENEGETAQLLPSEVFALEAVIEADGSRPVLFVQGGTINIKSPELQESHGWSACISAADRESRTGRMLSRRLMRSLAR